MLKQYLMFKDQSTSKNKWDFSFFKLFLVTKNKQHPKQRLTKLSLFVFSG